MMDKAEDCLDLAKTQHDIADKQHERADKLDTLAETQRAIADQQHERADKLDSLAKTQHEMADQQHDSADKLDTLGQALTADAVELKGELEMAAGRSSPRMRSGPTRKSPRRSSRNKPFVVMPGLDPGIHLFRKLFEEMDCRVNPRDRLERSLARQ